MLSLAAGVYHQQKPYVPLSTVLSFLSLSCCLCLKHQFLFVAKQQKYVIIGPASCAGSPPLETFSRKHTGSCTQKLNVWMLDEGSAKERMGFLYNLWSYEIVLLVYINSFDLSVFQGKSVVWGWGKIPAKTRNTLADHSCSLALPSCTYASVDRLLIGK